MYNTIDLYLGLGGMIMRTSIILKCSVCGEENYLSEKNKRNTPDRIEEKKYCPRCRKVTIHKEKNKK